MLAHAQPLAQFLVGTGARWGEAVVLTPADWDRPNVRIRKALKSIQTTVDTYGHRLPDAQALAAQAAEIGLVSRRDAPPRHVR